MHEDGCLDLAARMSAVGFQTAVLTGATLVVAEGEEGDRWLVYVTAVSGGSTEVRFQRGVDGSVQAARVRLDGTPAIAAVDEAAVA